MARTKVMGILNVTPDSFSDGGQWFDHEAAIEHGRQLIADGADLLDVGGESTRPGAVRPPADEERRRVVDVVSALAPLIPISVDTMRADVASAVIDAGASIINDVSGGLADERMLSVVADADVDYICQHWRGQGDVMNDNATYGDVVSEVRSELMARVDACLAAGIKPERIIIDPGLGFGKLGDHDWEILAALDEFTGLGYRVLIGASRKRFLGTLLSDGDTTRPAAARDAATAAVTMWCAQAGIWAVRTHEVRAQADAVLVAQKLDQIQAQHPPLATTRVSLTGLRARGNHGVFDFERRDGQEFMVDVAYDLALPSEDEIEQTVSYATLSDEIAAIVRGEPVNLIETLAARIADQVMTHHLVQSVEVTVHKPQAPIAEKFSDVSAHVQRNRDGRTVLRRH